MHDLGDELKQSLRDLDYAEAYADSFLDLYLATQLKVLREQRQLTQDQLAELIGTTQGGVSRIENANYSGWSVKTLKKLARALRVRLRISFEEFGTLPQQVLDMRQSTLERCAHESDHQLFPERLAIASNVTNISHSTHFGTFSIGPSVGVSQVGAMTPSQSYAASGTVTKENVYASR